jgi:prephenate dehydratase
MESKEQIHLNYKLVQGKKLSREEITKANIEASKKIEASKALRKKVDRKTTEELLADLNTIKDTAVMNEYKLDILKRQLHNLEQKRTRFELMKEEGVASYKEKSIDSLIQEIKDAIKDVKENMKAINFGKEDE